MTASQVFTTLASALAKRSLRIAGTRFAALRASSAGTDLYRIDVPFLLRAGSRTEGFHGN